MKRKLFQPNITGAGRIVRAILALAMLVGGIALVNRVNWAAILLFVSAAFVLFEAARGWCVMRACGIKTKL